MKHLSQALILDQEERQGYTDHAFLVIGHLAEASEECLSEYPDLALRIREHRIAYTEGFLKDEYYSVPFFGLLNIVKGKYAKSD